MTRTHAFGAHGKRGQTGQKAGLFFACLVLVLPCLMLGGGPALAGQVLQPHRVLYTFTLGKADPGSDIASIDGGMRVAMERSCDGWVMGQDVNMHLGTSEGGVISNRLRFAALESFDGRSYEFIVRNLFDDTVESIRGRASLSADLTGGEAVFREPIVEPIALPEGTLFPIKLLSHLIERAQAGETHVQAFSFDGTEAEGAQRAVAFIGPRRAPNRELVEKLGPLADYPGWTMRVAYFQDSRSDGMPEVEIELYQLENGVTPHLVLDYGMFTAEVEAVSIEAVAAPTCS